MTRIVWVKSESRQVRPFFSLENVESCLEAAEIRLFEGQSFTNSESFVLQQEELHRVQPAIRFNLEVPTLDADVISAKDLNLLICVTAPNLKKTKVVLNVPLSGDVPEVQIIDPYEIMAMGGAENLSIKLAICLNKQLPPAIGRPFLTGHWLAKKTFRVRLAKEASQFEVQPRSDAEWKAHGYPEKTLYTVEYIGGMNEVAEKDSPIGGVWVHADVFNRLAVDPNSKKARAIMGMLSSEIPVQLLIQSYQEWIDTEIPTSNSPLAAVIKQLSAAEKIDLNRLKQMTDQPGQAKLRALFQNQQAVVRSLVEF